MLNCFNSTSQMLLHKHFDIIQCLLSLRRSPNWEEHKSVSRSYTPPKVN
jgi:hypothetical protein